MHAGSAIMTSTVLCMRQVQQANNPAQHSISTYQALLCNILSCWIVGTLHVVHDCTLVLLLLSWYRSSLVLVQ